MRQTKVVVTATSLLLAASFLLSSCSLFRKKDRYTILPVETDSSVRLVDYRVVDYYQSDGSSPVSGYVDALLVGVPAEERESALKLERLDLGKATTLSFKTEHTPPEGVTVTEMKLLLSEKKDMSDAVTYTGDPAKQRITLSYLKTGCTYYYRFVQVLSDGSSVSSKVTPLIITAQPRFITVAGVGNLRDAGGYESSLGARVMQGMIYRGNELDGVGASKAEVPMWEEHFLLTEEGKAVMRDILGIRADMDLRSSEFDAARKPLGDDVTYLHHALSSYSGAFNANTQPVYRAAFQSFADPDNYPMYVHCTYGADRTGTIFFMLGALLGMSREDLIKEYELSGFFYESMSREKKPEFRSFLQRFDALPGATPAEKAEYWCRSIGVTDAEIASIREILLEQK